MEGDEYGREKKDNEQNEMKVIKRYYGKECMQV